MSGTRSDDVFNAARPPDSSDSPGRPGVSGAVADDLQDAIRTHLRLPHVMDQRRDLGDTVFLTLLKHYDGWSRGEVDELLSDAHTGRRVHGGNPRGRPRESAPDATLWTEMKAEMDGVRNRRMSVTEAARIVGARQTPPITGKYVLKRTRGLRDSP